MEPRPALEIKQLSKTFPTKNGPLLVLDAIDMHVNENEFVCIVGSSGCGKSTLLNIVAGLDTASQGEVLLRGRQIQGPGADRGMVFQNYTLYPWLSVAGNVEFGLKVSKVPKAERKVRVQHYLDIVGLTKFADAFPKQLSGGMKQRAAIARAMANEPEILLLDEPFGALDCQTKEVLQEFLLDVAQKTHKTFLMITHDVEEAIFLSERIYVFSARPGRICREVPIPLGENRDRTSRRTSRFLELRQDLTDLMRGEALLTQEVS
jgi:NitT/TauT family transport system ATP-binding protein